MSGLQIPVRLQKLRKGKSAAAATNSSANSSSERRRAHYGTVYFPEGTTANEVSEYIARRYQGTASMGLWLLQTATGEVKDGQLEQADDGSFANVKDSRHQLTDGNRYVALHYTGPDIYLAQP